MERLTYWNEEYGCWSYKCASGDAAKCLAAYEDTELIPEQIQAQQQEIEQIKTYAEECIHVSELEDYHNPTDAAEIDQLKGDLSDKDLEIAILCDRVAALVADKDQQAGTIMRYEDGLKGQRSFLQLLNGLGRLGYEKNGWITSHINAIDALLGGAE